MIRDSEKPDEYVVSSAHFDSWDGGSGATDNGTGTRTITEAMRILKLAYPTPKRTTQRLSTVFRPFSIKTMAPVALCVLAVVAVMMPRVRVEIAARATAGGAGGAPSAMGRPACQVAPRKTNPRSR